MEKISVQVTDDKIFIEGEYAGFIQHTYFNRWLLTLIFTGKTEVFFGTEKELHGYIHTTVERCKRGEIRLRATSNAATIKSLLHASWNQESNAVGEPPASERSNTEKNEKLFRKTRGRYTKRKMGN